MYLDYAEVQAERRQPIYMKDWAQKLDAVLQFNEREILKGFGTVSMEVARQLSLNEYQYFKDSAFWFRQLHSVISHNIG